jgi:predicted esterase
MDALSYAHERGIWFHVRAFDQPLWSEYRKQEQFQAILARNTTLWQEAQRDARPQMFVTEPERSEAGQTYPLFIALHGGGGNMTNFRDVWKSDLLSKEFVVAYLQSSQMVAMDGYSWTENLETARREITDAYEEILSGYPVNEDQVFVGGFSSGGMAALEVVLQNDFPVVGFVALCPARTDGFTASAIARAKDGGVRGTILSTEMDPNLPAQEEMVEMLKTAGLQYQFVVTPDVGHWIPDDLPTMLDQAIQHIRSR